VTWDPAALPRGEGQIRLQVAGAVAEVVLDNPRARNAMSLGMMVDLVAAVKRLESEEVAVVLIRGEGTSAFCAGGDLRSVAAHLMEKEHAAGMCAVMGDALDRLSSLPAVIVAAVEGAALGGGAEILSACDVVVAATSARIGFIHASLGVSPGWGGGGRLVRRIGAARALRVLTEARRLDVDEAREMGLVDRVVLDGLAEAGAKTVCTEICSQPTAAIRGAVQLVRAWRDDPASASGVEKEVFGRLWGSEDHVAALARVLGP